MFAATHSAHTASFAFTGKYLDNGSLLAALFYSENGNTVIGTNGVVMAVAGNTAVVRMQASLNGTSGYTAIVTGIDNSVMGSGHDQFGLMLIDPHGVVVSNLTFAPITVTTGEVEILH